MNNYLALKRRIFIITFVFLLSGASHLYGQSFFDYKGYLQNTQTVWAPPKNNAANITINSWLLSGLVYNRFDFFFYPTDGLSINIGMRNLIDYGNMKTFVDYTSNYADIVTKDEGYFDLTWKWSEGTSYVFYTNLDRLNIFYSGDNIEFQLGRQRINWGVNLVWTPNDIFNSFSYLNFDYAERPGSDAGRIQYYFGFATSLEFVYKIDYNNDITSALMFKFNEWDYDFQFFAGTMVKDYVLGGGWSGNISSANFSGEVTYFRDKENFADTTGQLVSSLGLTYTFPENIYLHGEFLYNSTGKLGKAGGAGNFFQNPYSAKNLSPAKYSLFGDVAYQITPLIRIDLSSIFNPSDRSFYIGPFTDISLSQSIDLLLAGQFFFGDNGTEWGDYGQFYYLRIKWNF
ncbi:hypothetical protein MNBD_IGNAVI01-3136 [hydrothermal vent metagenome]|uniref:Alginate export domain-containing protein n=1 Tax=hydrothermal vent metagenome TaxID=652676 RepID=A0A3B1C0E4_9ZZZZ